MARSRWSPPRPPGPVLAWRPERTSRASTSSTRTTATPSRPISPSKPPLPSHPPPDPQADANAATATAYDGELERTATSARRGEQAALKRHLLPGPTEECALCGRTLPAGFLIAAHITKRAICTDDEKRDFATIAMVACSLGCDSLYERGYITVTDTGHISPWHRTRTFKPDPPA
ncbi:hypothetical protein [Streptomyces sp. CBMA123]|uniref:hypothetical protein n=1 Tax=Streptomyces sp. CBMA123 TaxID=1896313 RepID=UPI0016621082|nr:hypothetical protein [Streptomyces sp. CBMA123]